MGTIRRILVVDDEAAIHELIAEYLRGRGMDVEVARSGGEARALLDASSFDLVLTDLKLPDIDGQDIVRLAARHSPPIPSIVMTGYGTVEGAVMALQNGAQQFLLKPFKLREIHAAIERAIERARQHRETLLLSAAVAFFEQAELAVTPGDANALLMTVAGVVALLPGVEVAAVLQGTAARAVVPKEARPPTGTGFHLGGNWTIVVSPPSSVAIPYALAVARARERCGA